jgi:hypothetical protein
MNGVVIIPAQSGSVAKQLCNAQFEGITPVKDTLLTLIVMVGALAAYWVVLFQQYRKRPRPGSRYYGSAGGGGDAGGEGGGHNWFGGHGHSGDHGSSGDTGGSDAGGGDGGGGDGGGGGGD